MPASLLGRWFGVPLVIVSLLVGSAMLVTFLFGSIAADRHRSIDSLLLALESASGEKVGGALLLGRDKELWQMARELAMRLEDRDDKFGPGELDEVARRLSALLERDLAVSLSSSLSETGRQRMHFFMRALSQTGRSEAVPVLVRFLDDAEAATRREALLALGTMGALPGVRNRLDRICLTLEDEDAVVRTVSCWVMSVLARPDDAEVVGLLAKACDAADREVRWNAALTLARLGNGHGKGILLDLLDREYWENKVRVQIAASNGRTVENPMPPQAVDRYLMAAIGAASHLNDADLAEAVFALRSDRSPRVKDRARSAGNGG